MIDWDVSSAPTYSVESDRRHIYWIMAANEHGESGPSEPAEADTYLVAIAPFIGMDDTPWEDWPPHPGPASRPWQS